MKTFLDELAEDLLASNVPLGDIQLVFPNRRAGLFFEQRLSTKINQPMWSPEVVTMEEFICGFSSLRLADPLTLVFELYHAFEKAQEKAESFEKFYFWGEMLLRDFEEIDQALIKAAQIFQGVKNQKEIDELFYFLSDQDKATIQSFWATFFPEAGKGQERFLKTWKVLKDVYNNFTEQLKAKGIGYKGLIYKEVADNVTVASRDHTKKVVFVGFNALTPAEEVIIKYFVGEKNASAYWDYDDYYTDAKSGQQEAGTYLRQYQKDVILGPTFTKEPKSNFNSLKVLEAIGVSLEVGQAKAAGAYLIEALTRPEFKAENTVVVLPQEYMLFPMMNALPGNIEKVNVTMGYPLKETPLYSFIEALIKITEYQKTTNQGYSTIFYKPVVSILAHPYMHAIAGSEIEQLLKEIKAQNMVQVPVATLQGVGNELIKQVFTIGQTGQDILKNIIAVLRLLHDASGKSIGLEEEYLYNFHQVLARLSEILELQKADIDAATLLKLFGKIARSIKIPFSGEPLHGLQIMGLMETRNLDFENVIILSMNEDSMPGAEKSGSFIPYNIRKAFGLPTYEQQDAIYAYLFYRLLQRAKNVQFYYNTDAAFGISGEVSRFIRQLNFESEHKVVFKNLAQQIYIKTATPIVIQKTGSVLKSLNRFLRGGTDSLSPTPLSVFQICSLKFYFQYIARLKEPDIVSEQIDAAMFGTILHDTLEILYKNITKTKGSNIIAQTDFFSIKSGVDGAMEQAFRKFYHLDPAQRFPLEGRNVILHDLVKDYVQRILSLDEQYAPFEMIAIEGKGSGYKTEIEILIDGVPQFASIKGTIDRIDKKNGKVRVLDYKSGRDKREVKDIEALFDPHKDQDWNKAAFQLYIYSLLYIAKHGDELPISVGLFNITELYQEQFEPELYWKNGSAIMDVRGTLPPFKEKLAELLTDMFDSNLPFEQTTDIKKCEYCPYKGICHR
jgi:hypothetical protein